MENNDDSVSLIPESYSSSDRLKLVEYLLAEEVVMCGRDMSTKQWKSMLQTYEESLDEAEFKSACMITSLGLACCIVGSGSTAKFNRAFCLLVRWEGVGGAYWVVQVELIRHYLLFAFMMDTDNTLNLSKIDQWLITAEQCTANPKLQLALAQIRTDMAYLSRGASIENEDELYFSGDGNISAAKAFREYVAEHPLDKFVTWCVNWSIELLGKAFSIQMRKALPANNILEDSKIPVVPNEVSPPRKLRRKYQRANCKAPVLNTGLFANIAVLSYEEDTDDTTEMSETVKLGSFLTQKMQSREDNPHVVEDGEAATSGNQKGHSIHDEDGKEVSTSISQLKSTVENSQDMPFLSQKSTIVSDTSSDYCSEEDSDASIQSSDKPDTLFQMVQKAVWRVL